MNDEPTDDDALTVIERMIVAHTKDGMLGAVKELRDIVDLHGHDDRRQAAVQELEEIIAEHDGPRVTTIDVFADRSMVDWDEVDRIAATLGQSDCMICAAVAAVILRIRERSDVALCGAATESEVVEACNFVKWKTQSIKRVAGHD